MIGCDSVGIVGSLQILLSSGTEDYFGYEYVIASNCNNCNPFLFGTLAGFEISLRH
jgi:hypothetical protein